jgi:hypothetical protein
VVLDLDQYWLALKDLLRQNVVFARNTRLLWGKIPAMGISRIPLLVVWERTQHDVTPVLSAVGMFSTRRLVAGAVCQFHPGWLLHFVES